MNLIFLDTETTGNEIGKDRLCQLCYKTNAEVFVGYFKPPIPISVKAMSITHITNSHVADSEPFQGSSTQTKLQELLNEGILVAHAAKFDIAMLEAEGVVVPRFICTLRVARYLDKEDVIPEYNLQYLRYYLELDVEGEAHNAEDDVVVLEALFERELEKVMKEVPDRDEAIQKMVEISSVPTLFNKFNFGKYKGQLVADVKEKDPRYLEWLLNQKLENEQADEDWIHTLKHHLG